MARRHFFIFVCGWALSIAGRMLADDAFHPSAQDTKIQDAVQPAAAAQTIRVPAGFRVELVAAEPLVHDPIAMEFDENGAAYVIELPHYNEYGTPGRHTPCSICKLEDTDGDGRFDKRIEFAPKLNYPTGMFCYDGGVFVGDPPDLLFLRDTDGDGRADQREVVLTGIGAACAGESQLNSFRWGLDNRIHICTGLDGGEIRLSKEPNAKPRSIRNRRILLEPRSRTFELTSGGGQNGMSFDDWGRLFVCDNSRPIQTIVYDDRYIERNPLMMAPAAEVHIGPGANFGKLLRISPAETWRRIRARLRSEGKKVDDTYEFDRISGVFTSATGITIYRGDAWPAKFRGEAFIGDVANNLVYHARLQSDGPSVTSKRADTSAEFLASTDTWFRPAQFAHGPDGNLYVIDMYRQLIEGVQWVPPEVLAEMDPTTGSDRGRIYRIVPEGFKQPPPVRLGDMPTEKLVALLEHPNSWHRETAARLIYQRQDQNAVPQLRRLAAKSKFPQGRMHALYALDGLQSLDVNDMLRGLTDEHPRVREHAVRLAERFAHRDAAIGKKFVEMTQDPDDGVRFQLAFSLGCLPNAGRDGALLALLRRDGTDSWFRMAIQSSLATGAAEFVQKLLADSQLRDSEHGKELLGAILRQVGRGQKKEEIRVVLAALDRIENTLEAADLTKTLVSDLLADGAGASFDQLTAFSHGRVKSAVAQLLPEARSTAADSKQSPEQRSAAIALLGCGRFADERSTFEELLKPNQPQAIQQAALKTLGRFSEPTVAELLITQWATFSPAQRTSATELLLSRSAWTERLLDAVQKNQIARADFDPARIALLKSQSAPAIRDRATTIFAGSGVARRAEVVTRYQPSLKLRGDRERGRAVFQKSCASCHNLDGKGNSIGADLRAARDHGPEALLINILDPNREVLPRYLTYIITTAEGRTLTGIITEETPNNITVRQADGTTVEISRGQIEEMKSTGLSYMPEGLETQIDHQAMADLLAYVMSGEQGTGSGEKHGNERRKK